MIAHIASSEHVITADRLEHLPPPVQRYLTYSGVVGTVWVKTIRLSYSGRFRLGADKPWLPIHAEQVYTTQPPGFRWRAHFNLFGLPLMYGDDTYKDGHGHMFGKLLGVFQMFDARGEQMDQGTMLRYLQEMCWFPSAYLSDYITWEGIDDHCAVVHFIDGGRTVSARMYFDDAGRLLSFIGQRYREQDGAYSLGTWSTPMTTYARRAGLMLPVRGQGVWILPEGDLPYIDISVDDIAYNVPITSF